MVAITCYRSNHHFLALVKNFDLFNHDTKDINSSWYYVVLHSQLKKKQNRSQALVSKALIMVQRKFLVPSSWLIPNLNFATKGLSHSPLLSKGPKLNPFPPKQCYYFLGQELWCLFPTFQMGRGCRVCKRKFSCKRDETDV